MGAKPEFIRKIALKIYNEHRDEITTDFEENKNLLKQIVPHESKKVRNMIAGYLTRLKKKEGQSSRMPS